MSDSRNHISHQCLICEERFHTVHDLEYHIRKIHSKKWDIPGVKGRVVA